MVNTRSRHRASGESFAGLETTRRVKSMQGAMAGKEKVII